MFEREIVALQHGQCNSFGAGAAAADAEDDAVDDSNDDVAEADWDEEVSGISSSLI